MLPQDQLQQFIVRAVTGHGDRVQSDCNDAMMKEATQKISIMAGLATFNFKKVRIIAIMNVRLKL